MELRSRRDDSSEEVAEQKTQIDNDIEQHECKATKKTQGQAALLLMEATSSRMRRPSFTTHTLPRLPVTTALYSTSPMSACILNEARNSASIP
ncbi:hypothetical protein M514_02128 [Trichuris suis]|uniref:Uncharacterized protein n=1 Tax=Trichuris suis TaxID=68888 RepID=A0A085MWW0_9BILA|nr:hypothetical protein M513_02128 [Trichuris suis]KFD61706.1 hypothetical protein M514_02128 [Trichuris suis]